MSAPKRQKISSSEEEEDPSRPLRTNGDRAEYDEVKEADHEADDEDDDEEEDPHDKAYEDEEDDEDEEAEEAEEDDEWTTLAAPAIHFKLVRKPEDLENEATTFHPVFTHQLFDKERIRGYKGLRVDIYRVADSLITYFKVSYDERAPDAEDVERPFRLRMLHPYTSNLNEFVAVCCLPLLLLLLFVLFVTKSP
jgi:histone acetyltransferase 1